MISQIQLITPEECDKITARLSTMEWKPGVSPSEEYTRKVKTNLEIPMGQNSDADALLNSIINTVLKNKVFTRTVLPHHVTRPRFSLAKDGGGYGRHADSSFMGSKPEVRTDVTMVLFLNDPETYEGGEHCVEFPSGTVLNVKPQRGTLVFYPTGVMHHVVPVTSGERTCFVAWVQSHIRDPQKRDLLAEINILGDDLAAADNLGDSHIKLTNIRHNLIRQWMGQG
jgi:PKHD-type hydroxylase